MLTRFPASHSRAARRAFTLLEIMVVIALIGLLASVLAVGASQLMRDRKTLPEDVVWQAFGEARKFALTHETEVWLSFDNEEQVFHASTALGQQDFPVPDEVPEFELEFLGMNKGERTIMIGGTLLETGELKGVRFFGDGTCSPFRAQLVVRGEQPIVLEIDPWTCAPILRDKEDR